MKKGAILTGIPFGYTVFCLIREIVHTQDRTIMLDGMMRFYTLLVIGAVAAATYGTLWTMAEKMMGTSYDAGGNAILPSGFPALVLSLTLTFPLVIIPRIYEMIFGLHILHSKHWTAAAIAILGGAIAHLMMYGINSIGFPGIRSWLMPPVGNVRYLRAVFTEIIYALAYFGGIAFAYRYVLAAISPQHPAIPFFRITLAAVAFVLGMATVIAVLFPKCLVDPGWVRLRGVLSGLIMPMCLSAAMYL